MRLSPERVEQTLNQIEAHVIPDTHPSMPQIKRLWGDHTYFLDVNGLNIVEPIERNAGGEQAGQSACLVNIASWTDESATQLVPHEPEATEVVVEFDKDKNGDDDDDDDDDDDNSVGNAGHSGVKH
jgi:hypothetical protein